MGTQYFDLEKFGADGRISDKGYKFSLRDRDTLDSLLWMLVNHDHRDVSVGVMTGPTTYPVVTVSDTGGNIGAGVSYYYKISFVDEHGSETEASAAASATTDAAIASPATPVLATATTGGSLSDGVYRYVLSYYQSTGGETRALNTASVLVPSGTSTNTVTITLPAIPTGATGWNVYRKGPTDTDYFYLASQVAPATEYVDDGSVAASCTVGRPTSNDTNSTNKVVIDIDSNDLPLDSRVAAWKIYRSSTVGVFGPSSLFATVVETTTEGGSDLVTTYTDTGGSTFTGSPLSSSVVPPPVPQLDASDIFSTDSERLPATVAPQGVHAQNTFLPGTLAAGTYNQFYVPYDMPVERFDAYFKTAPTGLDGSNYLTLRVKDDSSTNEKQSIYTDAETVDEVQYVYNNATSGTFTLSDGTDTTSAIAFDATAITVETRLEADIAAITDVNVSGVGTSGSPWVITWVDPSATNISYALSTDDTNLVGGASTVTVVTNGSDGGTFRLSDNAVAARGTLTMDTQPTNGDTFTVDTKTYTFQTTLTDSDGNIAIGADLAGSQANLVAAFDLSGTAGTDYAVSMTAHTSVDCWAFSLNDAVMVAKIPGTSGNSIATTETFTAGTNVFDAATLGTTLAGTGDSTNAIAYNASAATIETRLETDIAAYTNVTVTGSGTVSSPWVVEFVDPGGQAVDLMVADSSLLNGTTYVSRSVEGHGVTQVDVVVDQNQSYHYWQSSTTDFGEQEGEDALGDGTSVSDAFATNDVAAELTGLNDWCYWTVGSGLNAGDYVAKFYVYVDPSATYELQVYDVDGSSTAASSTVADGSTYIPAHELAFTDTGGTESWRFSVTKTDSGTGVVRVDKFEYGVRHPTLHAGSTASVEVLVTGSPTTNGDDVNSTIWY